MHVLDVMKEVGKRWGVLNEEGRIYFLKKADVDKIRFSNENKKFLEEMRKLKEKSKDFFLKRFKSSTILQKRSYTLLDEKSDHEQFLPPLKKQRREPGQPKKPLSAYIYFSQEVF
jgi:hypothetical protein